MAKNQEFKAPKGNRINGRKASAESYIPFYEFLLFDPKYRKMKQPAKILYAYLRKKSIDNDKITQLHEGGEEGTRSYRDEDGDIYVIADTAELMVILQCSEPSIVNYKKELKKYGLLDPVEQFNENGKKKADHLYVLTPQEEELTERWLYIEEIKEHRKELKEENKKKQEKRKKQASKDRSEKSNETNLNILSGSNLNILSGTNLNFLSKIYFKGFKSTLNLSKSTINLSIKEEGKEKEQKPKTDRLIDPSVKNEIHNLNIPDLLKNTLLKYGSLLEQHNVPLQEIETLYSEYKDHLNDMEINQVLHRVCTAKNIEKSFVGYLRKALTKDYTKKSETQGANSAPQSADITPEWYKQGKHKEKPQGTPEEVPYEEMSEEQRKVAELLKQYTEGAQ